MKERPILFNAPMVRAIMDGKKSQTRRVVKGLPDEVTQIKPDAYGEGIFHLMSESSHVNDPIACPYGKPGDQLWVRETFCPIYPQDASYNNGEPIEYDYAATYKHGDRLGDSIGIKKKWTPSIYMPRKASRIDLEISGIRVERLQDISEADAIAEGLRYVDGDPFGRSGYKWSGRGYEGGKTDWFHTPDGQGRCRCSLKGPSPAQCAYRCLWESINGPGSWEANPWVWVIEFRRIKP